MKVFYKTVFLEIVSNENDEIFYIHPVTNAKCEHLNQCFSNWSEMDQEKQKEWNELVEKIKNDEYLFLWVFDDKNKNY